jgi:hypothetical protein
MLKRDFVVGAKRGRARRGALVLLVLGSTALALGALELGLRLRKGQLWGVPDPQDQIRLVGNLYPGSHDPILGFVPTPGSKGRLNAWRKLVTITPKGTRSNGLPAKASGASILAVGDSFTFGDEVDDSDTWPAALERKLRRSVINGGVFGYGFDQTVLRSERLMDEFNADTLIVSVIPDDIQRCEHSFRFAWKPYFEAVDGKLELRNTPVPPPGQAPPGTRAIERALRYSFLADLILRRLDPADWMIRGNMRAHRQGAEISRLLVDRLADSAKQKGHRLLILIQWHPNAKTERLVPLLAQAEARGLEVVIVEPPLRKEITSTPDKQWLYFTAHSGPGGSRRAGHMTRAGNEWIAQQLAPRLRATRPDR